MASIPLTIRISKELGEELKEQKKVGFVSVGDFVRTACRDLLRKQKQKRLTNVE